MKTREAAIAPPTHIAAQANPFRARVVTGGQEPVDPPYALLTSLITTIAPNQK